MMSQQLSLTLPKELTTITDLLIEKGYQPVIVGGYIRDTLLGISSKDIDIEVYSIESLELLESLLKPFGDVNSVGRSFGVLKVKINELEIDISLPRLEKKSGVGHRGFEVTTDSSLSFNEAALRRDFTINAMGYDIKHHRVLDPYDGQDDLRNDILRVVNAESFVEDPLRLYRAMQFAARFELTLSKELVTLANAMVAEGMLDDLPKERVYDEFKKLLLKSRQPSIGLSALVTLGIIKQFPELQALIGVEQDPSYHPEGDVWTHTLMVVDETVKLYDSDEKLNLQRALAALCHDLGKANTTEKIDGRIRAIGHEHSGVLLTETFLSQLTEERGLIENILALVKNHLAPMQFYKQGAKSPAIRRLANRVNIAELIILAKADFLGRTTAEALKGEFKAGEWLQKQAKALKVHTEPLAPLLQGRDLMHAGMKPSKAFKTILNDAYEAQIDEAFSTHDEALSWLKKYMRL